MNIAAITPTKDRPLLLENCKRLVAKQQEISDHRITHIIASGGTLVENLIKGLNKVPPKTDVIVIIEDDDWYSQNWINNICELISNGSDIVGESIGRYYHYQSLGYRIFDLLCMFRSSLSSTAISISKAQEFEDMLLLSDSPWVDLRLWDMAFDQDWSIGFWNRWDPMVIGMKGFYAGYGIGHNKQAYIDRDTEDRDILCTWIGEEDCQYYEWLCRELA